MMRSKVDLPAPFTPRMPTLLPVGNTAETESSTVFQPDPSR